MTKVGPADSVFTADKLLGLRSGEHLAFIALSDKDKQLIYSEPKQLWRDIMRGASGQFVDKYGWTIYRLSKTDAQGNEVSLGVYAGSQLWNVPEQSLVECRISIESVILILLFEYFCLALFMELTFSSVLRDINRSLGDLSLGSRHHGFLSDQFVVPWFWSEDLRLLRQSMLKALRSYEQTPPAMQKTISDQVKWRSPTLELEKSLDKFESEPLPSISTSFTPGFANLDSLLLELVNLMGKRLGNSLSAAIVAEKHTVGPWQDHWKVSFTSGFEASQSLTLTSLELDEIAEQIIHAGRSRILGTLNVAQYKLDNLATLLGARSVACLPLTQNTREMGVLLLFCRNEPAQVDLSPVERLWHSFRNSYYELYLAKISHSAEQIDKTTGLYNRKFVQLALAEPLALKTVPIAMNLAVIADTASGAPAAPLPDDSITASLLLEFAKLCSLQSDLQTSLQCAIQDENQFVVLYRSQRDGEARTFLTRLGKFLTEAYYKIGYRQIAVVFGVCNESVSNKLEELRFATRAAEYGKTVSGENSVRLIESASVPKNFNDWGKSSVLRGKLGVFDAAEILQSLASGQRTGRFVVDNRQGRTFCINFDNGKPVAADMAFDKRPIFCGTDAICEYVTTFSSGDFIFTEMTSIEGVHAPAMPPLFNCLMTAALAADHLSQAQQILSVTDTVTVTSSEQSHHQLLQSGEMNPLEQKVIQQIESICHGQMLVADLIQQLGDVPTHRLWHSLALMKIFGLLQVQEPPGGENA